MKYDINIQCGKTLNLKRHSRCITRGLEHFAELLCKKRSTCNIWLSEQTAKPTQLWCDGNENLSRVIVNVTVIRTQGVKETVRMHDQKFCLEVIFVLVEANKFAINSVSLNRKINNINLSNRKQCKMAGVRKIVLLQQ